MPTVQRKYVPTEAIERDEPAKRAWAATDFAVSNAGRLNYADWNQSATTRTGTLNSFKEYLGFAQRVNQLKTIVIKNANPLRSDCFINATDQLTIRGAEILDLAEITRNFDQLPSSTCASLNAPWLEWSADHTETTSR